MAIERTLTMIKPDATAAGNTGNILALLEKAGFKIIGLKKVKLTKELAEGFYAVHKERPFFGDLVKFMTEGPISAACLEREDAVTKLREVMGATDSKKAAEGTVRALYGTDIERNAIHGSDSTENAAIEIAFHFNQSELVG
ncbi:MAG: nucleoside-diphosphate kinase [Acidobacteria bacterium]|nr:nucleoside-diphosphate kinase [Acidobacteriota bacterium]